MNDPGDAEVIVESALSQMQPFLQSPAATSHPADLEQLLEALYPRLRALAGRILREDAPVLTLQPTELAHEVVLRLLRLERMDWNDRGHFLAFCARLMRQVVVDAARRARAMKRRHIAVTTSWLHAEVAQNSVEPERMDELLSELEQFSAEHARIVELRFFVGLSIPEIAEALQVSESTIKRQWQSARAWLLQRMN